MQRISLHDHLKNLHGRRGGLMVSALASRSSATGLSPGWGHHVVFLGKACYCQSASLHPGAKMAICKFNAGVTLWWTSILSRESRNTPSHFMLCTETRDKHQPDGPLSSSADFTIMKGAKKTMTWHGCYQSIRILRLLHVTVVHTCTYIR